MNADVRAITLSGPPRIDQMQRIAINFIGAAFAWNHDVLPLRFENDTLTIAIPPSKFAGGQPDRDLIAAVAREARGLDEKKIAARAQSVEQIRERLKVLYPRPRVPQSDAARTWEKIVEEAVKRGVSDVIVRPCGDHGEVLMRIDNVVYPSNLENLPLDLHDLVIGLLKNKGDVKPANQSNLPGDGSMTVLYDGRSFDIRINTLPMGQGHEQATVRFGTLTPRPRTLEILGMSPAQLDHLKVAVGRPEFFIIIAGPVGAGKSTLAYAILLSLDRKSQNVVSLENPVEQHIEDVCQVPIEIGETQANERTQMTFAMAARALLRSNPDIEFLGECRDAETMREAIKAANTGISMLTTLHCRSALHVVNRMQILDAKPREIADSVTMATSQRLINRLCPRCRVETKVIGDETQQIADFFKIDLRARPVYAVNPRGCELCNAGQSGRIGAFEFLKFSVAIREAIGKDASVQELARIAIGEGYRPMPVNAIEHLAEGIVAESAIRSHISYEDILHVVSTRAPREPAALDEKPFISRTSPPPRERVAL